MVEYLEALEIKRRYKRRGEGSQLSQSRGSSSIQEPAEIQTDQPHSTSATTSTRVRVRERMTKESNPMTRIRDLESTIKRLKKQNQQLKKRSHFLSRYSTQLESFQVRNNERFQRIADLIYTLYDNASFSTVINECLDIVENHNRQAFEEENIPKSSLDETYPTDHSQTGQVFLTCPHFRRREAQGELPPRKA